MSKSHLQTRTMTDALDGVDRFLKRRGTQLKLSEMRRQLAENFSPQPYPDFFNNWVFTAAEYEQMRSTIEAQAPELSAQLQKPTNPGDFTLVGHCSLDLRFNTDANGADATSRRLANGTVVKAASIKCKGAKQYTNGLISVPAGQGETVYFFQPKEAGEWQAATLALQVLSNRGAVKTTGINLSFPAARTNNLPDYSWVRELKSDCAQYQVCNVVGSGEAIVDHNGFFARETQVVQMRFLCVTEDYSPVVIDRPFLVFFADDTGVHAAAWFSWDAFIQIGERTREAVCPT